MDDLRLPLQVRKGEAGAFWPVTFNLFGYNSLPEINGFPGPLLAGNGY